MPTTAVINESTSGDRTIVSAPGSGKFIRVIGFFYKTGGAVELTWKSGSTAKTGAMPDGDGGGLNSVYCPEGWFDCGDNEALVLNLSAAEQVGGLVMYRVMGAGQ